MQTLDSKTRTRVVTPGTRNGKSRQIATTAAVADATAELRVLVVIASYGNGNDPYLLRLIDEYLSMPRQVDIVVLSNIPRALDPRIEVVVGLPARDPCSLPFGHKQIMADRLHRYDLFIYSEDDTLITLRNIDAFLHATSLLPENTVPGFLRYETGMGGTISYPDVHGAYHWDTQSVTKAGDSTFAFFTNEHAAVFMLTRAQLGKAIDSGGFLVAPHRGAYGLLESAATDPYTQCGLTKLICISELDSFLIPHLPNKYIGNLGLGAHRFNLQVKALLAIAAGDQPGTSLLADSARAIEPSESQKSYYEPVRNDLIGMIPATARNVLSIGCGWGATEEALAREGKTVATVPLDAAISACVDNSLVRIVQGDLSTAVSRLLGETFDCILISNILHLFEAPGGVLSRLAPLLARHAIVIIAVPNLGVARTLWRKFRSNGVRGLLDLRSLPSRPRTSRRVLHSWLTQGGMRLDRYVEIIPERAKEPCRKTFGLARALSAIELIVVAGRHADHHPVR